MIKIMREQLIEQCLLILSRDDVKKEMKELKLLKQKLKVGKTYFRIHKKW